MKKILITIIALSTSLATYACNCGETKGIESADVVAIGKVKSVKEVEYKLIVTMKIKKAFKGEQEKGQIIEITTPAQSAACGYNFTKGKYAIYGNNTDKNIKVVSCSHTEKLKCSQIKGYTPKKTIIRSRGKTK